MCTCSMISEEIYKFLGTMSCIKRYMYARIESKVGKELRQVLKLTSSLFTKEVGTVAAKYGRDLTHLPRTFRKG